MGTITEFTIDFVTTYWALGFWLFLLAGLVLKIVYEKFEQLADPDHEEQKRLRFYHQRIARGDWVWDDSLIQEMIEREEIDV